MSSATYPDYSPEVLRAFRIVATFFHSLATAATLYRIGHKIRTRRYWWDEGFVTLAGLLDVTLILCIWLRRWGLDHMAATGQTHMRVAISWAESMSYSCILWLARIAILTSTVRLLQDGTLKRTTIATCWAFTAAWFAICAQKAYMCKKDTSWHYEWRVDCRPGTSYTVIKITTDVISCMLLVGLPLRMLWNSALPKFERWMIRIVFTSSILSAAVSAVHDIYLLGSNRILEGYSGHIEAAITLTVSNLLVITTRFYRCVRRTREARAPPSVSGSESDSSSTTRSASRTQRSRTPTTPLDESTQEQRRSDLHLDDFSFTQLDTLDMFSSQDTNMPRAIGNLGSTFELPERGRSSSVEIGVISRPKPVLAKDDPDIFLRRIRPP